jgi:hypothetical protein
MIKNKPSYQHEATQELSRIEAPWQPMSQPFPPVQRTSPAPLPSTKACPRTGQLQGCYASNQLRQSRLA